MNQQYKYSPTLINLSGVAIRLSEVRGVFTEKDSRMILLSNGMKIAITKEDCERVQQALSLAAKNIVREARRTGQL